MVFIFVSTGLAVALAVYIFLLRRLDKASRGTAQSPKTPKADALPTQRQAKQHENDVVAIEMPRPDASAAADRKPAWSPTAHTASEMAMQLPGSPDAEEAARPTEEAAAAAADDSEGGRDSFGFGSYLDIGGEGK